MLPYLGKMHIILLSDILFAIPHEIFEPIHLFRSAVLLTFYISVRRRAGKGEGLRLD